MSLDSEQAHTQLHAKLTTLRHRLLDVPLNASADAAAPTNIRCGTKRLYRTSAVNRYATVAAFLMGALVSSCTGGKEPRAYAVYSGGDAHRGAAVINMKQCGACHVIPGINGAAGLVGPPLFSFARRTYVAGEVANTPDNLVRWVMNPQSIEPHTAMPNLGLTEQQARDVAAYLYTRE